jgi:hypothetical protein
MSRIGITKYFLFIAWLIGFTMAVRATTANLRSNHVKPSDGLPHTSIRCMVQDNDGFLWIGTDRGLAKQVNIPSWLNQDLRIHDGCLLMVNHARYVG